MLLSARMLQTVTDVNSWEIVDSLRFSQGDTIVVYLQLVDLNKDRLMQGFKPSGRRYAPTTASVPSLQVTVQNIDDTKTIVRTATQAFPEDTSIWKFTLVPGDALRGGTFSIRLQLTETSVVTSGIIPAALSVVSNTGAFIV